LIDEELWVAAWEAGDDRVKDLVTDDCEIVAVTMSIEPRRFYGPDGAKAWLDDLRERFTASWKHRAITQIDPEAVIIEGTMYFAEPNPIGSLEQDYAVLFRLRGDKASWIGTFVNFEEAKETWKRGITGTGAG
jgi:SnoaL-like domain